MLNQVAPSVEICMNMILSEAEKSQKQALPVSELVQETKALRTEMGALKKSILTPQTPAEEDFLIMIAEGKMNEVITTVSEDWKEMARIIHIYSFTYR